MIRVIEDIRVARAPFSRVVITVGSFDGVHLGHRAILETVVRMAREHNGASVVLTLRPHPREFFSPEHAPSLLTSDSTKWRLFDAAGIDAVFILSFNAGVANLEPEAFVAEILVERCHAEAVVVGHDFRFGRKARGDFQLMVGLGIKYGFSVAQVEPLLMDGERVSSTLVRERLLVGDLSKAEAFLGRPYSIVGEVVAGRRIGATLGFPTANIRPYHSAIPAQGVYIAETLIDGRAHPTAVNIGVAPTIRNEEMAIEAHLLDYQGRLEGREIEVVFRERLRSEVKFPSREALIKQIQRDIGDVRAYFRRIP